MNAAVDTCGKSSIYLAAERGFAEIVELLLAHDPASSSSVANPAILG